MKIENTITQPQLEMLLRLANAMHAGNPAWRYGQSVFNALQVILPDLAEEIRGNPEVDPFNWPEDHGARWTQWYASVCPDPIKLAPGTTCPMCGLEIESEFDMEYTDEQVQELDKITQKVVEEVCFRCGRYSQIKTTETPFCDSCFKEVNEEYNEHEEEKFNSVKDVFLNGKFH